MNFIVQFVMFILYIKMTSPAVSNPLGEKREKKKRRDIKYQQILFRVM